MAIAAAVYIAFFASLFLMPRYGGSVADKNGLPPLAVIRIAGKPCRLDTNVTLFCAQTALLFLAALSLR